MPRYGRDTVETSYKYDWTKILHIKSEVKDMIKHDTYMANIDKTYLLTKDSHNEYFMLKAILTNISYVPPMHCPHKTNPRD